MLNPVHRPSFCVPGRNRGFSLIELMLAMLIGIIIIGGVMSLYLSTRNTQRVSEDQLQLLADARFVINTIGYDLRHASYWGEAAVNKSIICRLGDSNCTGADALAAATGDCDPGWYIDLERPMIASNNMTNFASTCTSKNYSAGTDVLGVHYADSNTVAEADLAADVVFLRSNYELGGLFIGDVIPTTSAYDGAKYWENTARNNARSKNRRLVSNVYYVSDNTDAIIGQPSLRKVELQPGPIMKDSVLLPGVVDLQFQFGVDTDDPLDASANSYVDVERIPLLNGLPDWARVRSVKIWVLVRSARKDKDAVATAQTFTMPNKAAKTYNDGYRYYLMTSIVKLRNTLEIDVK